MSDHIVSVDPLVIEIERLREQLAAERKKVQTLVDALKRIRDDKWIVAEASLHAADALEKVKEAKG